MFEVYLNLVFREGILVIKESSEGILDLLEFQKKKKRKPCMCTVPLFIFSFLFFILIFFPTLSPLWYSHLVSTVVHWATRIAPSPSKGLENLRPRPQTTSEHEGLKLPSLPPLLPIIVGAGNLYEHGPQIKRIKLHQELFQFVTRAQRIEPHWKTWSFKLSRLWLEEPYVVISSSRRIGQKLSNSHHRRELLISGQQLIGWPKARNQLFRLPL